MECKKIGHGSINLEECSKSHQMELNIDAKKSLCRLALLMEG